MKSLLDALQSGRLVELSSSEKEPSLKTLAHLIEAVPEMNHGIDLVAEMFKREGTTNSGIGLGVACPHVRVPGNGELICSVGWSPSGIDYGAADGRKVHLVAMYLIPDPQKNAYLKEISILADAVRKAGNIQDIAKAEDIPAVRVQLLGWVSSAIETGPTQVRARMIHLEARQAQAAAQGAPLVQMLPVLFVTPTDLQCLVLCENKELVATLEKDLTLAKTVRLGTSFDRAGWRFLHRSAILYDPQRPAHEYVAIKLA